MTNKIDEYLKTLYENGGKEKMVSNKVIAEAMQIAPASVTEMLTRLNKLGLVLTTPYKGSMLTDAGLTYCLKIIRSCHLWEVFLVEYLGYTAREALEESHQLEHVATDRLIDRLDNFLGNPKTCPHGSIIPRKNEIINREDLIQLSELKKGQKAIVRRVSENDSLLSYLERIDLWVGAEISITEVSDYYGSIEFLQDEAQKSISLKAAYEVFVELMKNNKLE
ncbi:MAG: metal-dependent transcriptional regulator [Defluviitaleaceae bacterium]|nr:metal-dependent transcriptional regulator [Defluviitaleaceae bacterium]